MFRWRSWRAAYDGRAGGRQGPAPSIEGFDAEIDPAAGQGFVQVVPEKQPGGFNAGTLKNHRRFV
jgi:hypothetical protein